MRYRSHSIGEDGWTNWIQPRHAKYLLRCCDCGLVHEMQFRVVKDEAASKLIDPDKVVKGLVVFRARRNERATRNARRKT